MKGESLYSISKKYNTTVQKLKSLNNLKSSKIKIGQKLKVG
jgi:LysM repeat protein